MNNKEQIIADKILESMLSGRYDKADNYIELMKGVNMRLLNEHQELLNILLTRRVKHCEDYNTVA